MGEKLGEKVMDEKAMYHYTEGKRRVMSQQARRWKGAMRNSDM